MKFTNILCYILVICGLVGNIFGLVIFSSSRRTWRISSVYVFLATCSSIINLFCIIRYALILHSESQYILSKLVEHIWLACKIYEFSFAFRIISSWITLFWMFERLTCVSKRLRSIFYRWNTSKFKFIFPFMIIIIILICVLGPSLYMYQPQIFEHRFTNSTTNKINNYCGLHFKASVKWQKYFYDVHFGLNHHTIRCLFSELIPAGSIILFNSCIIYHLIQTSRYFSQTNGNKISKGQRQTTSWMNIVLIIHSFLFLSSLLSHIVGHFMFIDAHETWWVLLTILVNCSLNFYVYCLSGKVFRQKIYRFIQQLTGQIFYKLQVCQQLWQQGQFDSNNDELIHECDHLEKIDKHRSYQPKIGRRSIRMNSSYQMSKKESSV